MKSANLMKSQHALIFPFLMFLIFGCGEQTDQSIGHWTQIESSDGSAPVARHEAAFVGVGDRFYLLGGRGIRPVSIFDTKTKKWTQGSPPPIEIHHFQPVVYKNKVYLMGAMTGPYPGEVPVDSVIIYDPSIDTWSKGAEIPADRRRGGAGAVLDGDLIYLVCGIKNGHIGDHKKWLDTYNLKTGEWKVLPDAPRPRDHFQAVVAGQKLYALAGRTTKANDNPFKNTIGEVDVYDIVNNTWSTVKEPLPTLRAGNSAVLFNEEILVFGGESFDQEPAHNEVEALHTEAHTWRSLAPLIRGRHGTSPVIFKNQVYLASGCGNRGGEPELQSMERFSFDD